MKAIDLIYQQGKVIYYQNGVSLGIIDMAVDGEYVFWPAHYREERGFWAWPVLQAIATLLRKANEGNER